MPHVQSAHRNLFIQEYVKLNLSLSVAGRKGKKEAIVTKKRRTPRSYAARQNRKSHGLSKFRLIDDRVVVFGFLAFLVIVLFLFDAAADQQSLLGYNSVLNTEAQSGGGTWSSAATGQILTKELADQVVSKLIVDSREKDGVAFIVKDTVDLQLLDYFTTLDYETIKAHLGIQSDFVIHFEDEEGRLIPIGTRFCFGSKDARINGVPCG